MLRIVPTFKVPAWLIGKKFPEGPAQILPKLIQSAAASPATDRGAEP